MEILPGILAYDAVDFRKRLLHPELGKVASTFHVDVLDGTLFGTSCWADPNVIGQWKNLPNIELHCMVAKPVPLVETWKAKVPTLKRVIVHFEIGYSLPDTLKQLSALEVEVLVAVNPTTAIDEIKRLSLDSLQIMGVEPGQSGQQFLGTSILSKIRRAQALFPNLTLVLDGGVSVANIKQIMAAGAVRCVASSALWKAESPAQAYAELLNKTIY